MKFRFSIKVTITGFILILAMLRLSYWQWQRHLFKIEYINILQERIDMPISDINEILEKNTDLKQIAYRRLKIEGEYDFEHEIVLRNRRFNDIPGAYVLTPLKLKDRQEYLFVSRGFIPISYSDRDKRKIFQKTSKDSFIGLAKESQTQKFLAPSDPITGKNLPWADAWLRVDIEKISRQLPFNVLPFYVEIMSTDNNAETEAKIVTEKSGRDDMFFLAGKSNIPSAVKEDELGNYPIAVYDTVVPPTRHLGYVFEWIVLALITFLICLVLQFRRPKELAAL